MSGVETGVETDTAARSPRTPGPDERDVAELTKLLDLLAGPTPNDQRARYLLSSNWFAREGVAVATRAAVSEAMFWAARR